MTFEEFNTKLIEIKRLLNSRPLTYLEEDNLHEPLTPVHLYCGHVLLNAIEDKDYDSNASFDDDHDQAVYRKHYLDQLFR